MRGQAGFQVYDENRAEYREKRPAWNHPRMLPLSQERMTIHADRDKRLCHQELIIMLIVDHFQACGRTSELCSQDSEILKRSRSQSRHVGVPQY